jgi:hypothetical protein
VTRLVLLYPRDWRARYEDEFLALLADRPPDPLGRLDIVRGAIDARLHPQVNGSSHDPAESPAPPSPWRSRAGWLAMVGGVLWILALVIYAKAPLIVESRGMYRDGSAAGPVWLAAIALLGVGMLGVAEDLPRSARFGRAAAYVGFLVGLVWAFVPWFLAAGLIAFSGLVVAAVAAFRAGRWSGLELGVLLLGTAAPWSVLLTVGLGLLPPPGLSPDLQFLVLGLLSAVWFVTGMSLLRAPRRGAASAAHPTT